MIDYLRHNNVPGIKQAAPPPPPPKTQPYTSGQIHIHIREFWDCHDDANNLSVEITMWDGAGVQIGFMKKTQAGASASAWMGSKLEDPLVITPEWANGGYIQFQIGLLGFDTHTDTDDSKPTHCHWGGFDPRDGPTCVVAIPPNPPRYYPDALSINNIDCWFPSVSLLPLVSSVWFAEKLTNNSPSGMVELLLMGRLCKSLRKLDLKTRDS